ncbi:unnamed protein product [Victoria cruziana]
MNHTHNTLPLEALGNNWIEKLGCISLCNGTPKFINHGGEAYAAELRPLIRSACLGHPSWIGTSGSASFLDKRSSTVWLRTEASLCVKVDLICKDYDLVSWRC